MKTFVYSLTAFVLLVSCAHKNSFEKSRNIAVKTVGKEAQVNGEDPYLWLEEVEGKKALDWAKERNEETFAVLKKDARFAPAEKELLEIYEDPEKIPYITLRGDYVYNIWRDAQHIQGLYRRTTLEEYKKKQPKWEVLIDFDELSKKEGKTWVYKGIECLAPENELCMIRLSDGGSDAAVAREFNLKTKKFVSKNAFYIPESKHRLEWVDSDTLNIGFDFGPESLTDSGYPRTSRVWKRGQKIEDSVLVFEGKKQDISVGAWRSTNPKHAFTVFYQYLDFYNSNDFVLFDEHAEDASRMIQIQKPTHVRISQVWDDFLLFENDKEWVVPKGLFKGNVSKVRPGSLVALRWEAVRSGDLQGAYEVIWTPSERTTLKGVNATSEGLVLDVSNNIRGEGYLLSKNGESWNLKKLQLPENGSLSFSSMRFDESNFIYSFEGFLRPESMFLYELTTDKSEKLKSKKSYFPAENFVVEQFNAKSRDGTLIPYFVVRAKDLKSDGSNPTYLYAYGGFQVSMDPWYSATMGTQWLTKGGVYVLANIRGGGEFGPDWHSAALKENRQNAFDDFHAVAEDLIARKITSPEHLGIGGGSNGGLLVGTAFTQRPDLYNAVVCSVPLLDMLRYHKLLAGASWMGEYGNPDIPEERAFLEKYSPYHNVHAGVDYPEVYFFTSTKDDRVHPGHARKMVARMQEQAHKVLYYENIEGGHGGAANLKQSAMQQAMMYVYLWQKLVD